MTGIHKFPQNFVNFDCNSTKTIQSLEKFWNSPRSRISNVWNPAKTVTVILGNPVIFWYPIQCRLQKCVDIFWNSPIETVWEWSYLMSVVYFVCSMEAPSKAFLLFFLLLDWLKLNHLQSRMECGFSDIFWRHICSTEAETIGVTSYAASFGAKKMFRKPHLNLLR